MIKTYNNTTVEYDGFGNIVSTSAEYNNASVYTGSITNSQNYLNITINAPTH